MPVFEIDWPMKKSRKFRFLSEMKVLRRAAPGCGSMDEADVMGSGGG